MSEVDAPSPRRYHTAVWTGTEMIVWGGMGAGNQALSDGARYDPLTDTWWPLPSDGAPSPRYDHQAIWTGTEMIIWGGVNTPELIFPGGAFDPVLGQWRAMSMEDAPLQPYGFSLVWTGTEMIVWGGVGSVNVMDQGGRYDPLADQWRSMRNLPRFLGRRVDHSAVWTGTEMIVWGGREFDRGEVVRDGLRYDPVTDTWASLSASSLLEPRQRHSSVWTGTEMIVWGGVLPPPPRQRQFTYYGNGAALTPGSAR
jgi:N-acetylneuraminic acid mutarotase